MCIRDRQTFLTLPEVLPPSVIPFWKPLMTPNLNPNSDAKILQIFCNPILQPHQIKVCRSPTPKCYTFLQTSCDPIGKHLGLISRTFSKSREQRHLLHLIVAISLLSSLISPLSSLPSHSPLSLLLSEPSLEQLSNPLSNISLS